MSNTVTPLHFGEFNSHEVAEVVERNTSFAHSADVEMRRVRKRTYRMTSSPANQIHKGWQHSIHPDQKVSQRGYIDHPNYLYKYHPNYHYR